MPNPPSLKQTITIEFHSQYAINLIEGTPNRGSKSKFHIIGLLAFASQIKQVNKDLNKGNPYAKKYMLLANNKFDIAQEEISKVLSECDDKINEYKEEGVIIRASKNNTPTSKEFNFTVPLCYQIAILLSKYDLSIRKLQSIKNVGSISEDQLERKVNIMSKAMRRMFHSIEHYKSLPVTVADIQLGNGRAIAARNIMGEIQTA